jgi:proline dehydrogenase
MSRFFFIARRFVAGESLDAAVEVVRRLNDRDLDVTLNLLGEHGHDRKQAEHAVQTYLVMLDHIHELELRANISLKLSHVGQDIDEIFCLENMHRILERAQAFHNFIRLDMEGSAYTQRTLDVFYALYERYKNTGVVIQAMLLRSPHDIARLNEVKARVRLCKGSYKEPPDLALQEMPNIRRAYLAIMETLLQYGHEPAFATHDDFLIEATQQCAAEHRLPKDAFEFQMLYGLRPRRQAELRQQGYRMRVYVPFGTEWMPYFYRRLRERKENVWFVLHNLFRR